MAHVIEKPLACRIPSDVSGHQCATEDAHPQMEIEELENYNGELAYEACTLKKQVLERDNKLKQQSCSIKELQEDVEARCAQRDCLSEEARVTEISNRELKEKYDDLLLRSQGLEETLREEELKQRDLIETMTKQKALEAENQNQVNESDVGSHEHRSPDLTDSPEGDKKPNRRFRSQSIPLGPSKILSALRSFFDFNTRKVQGDSSGPEDWHHSPTVCVICCLPQRALCNKEVHDSEVHAVKFCPNSRVVATGGADRVVKLWEVTGGTLQELQTLEGSHGGITSIEFDTSGHHILAASFDGAAHLWKTDSKANDSLTGHKGKVTAAKFKMCPHRAVTSSMDRTVKEWDLQKVACIRSISVSSYCSDVVCLDTIIISGHHDRKIRFWDSRSECCIREVTLEEKITSLFLGQDQTQLLSCSRDDALSLIDLRTGNVHRVLRADGFKCGCDWTKAILSPDGSYAIAGSADGTIFIWNTQTGLLERSLNGQHSAPVSAITWSASGDYVVSVDRGKKAVLWSEF
ncbi:protein Atg16l2 isoform X2 [Spea bombifrons]|uniref:protein Atg16l2 isoform X2 n=1 Tax=Spea bombifrons TaxID=233779 RepID=UPI002349E2E1|nr:protein Atg16l2 isoform X2 [Spea bombifrons]